MTPYYLTFFILASLHFVDLSKDKDNIKFILIIAASFYLILFAGLRALGTGSDDFNYYNMFIDVESLSDILFKDVPFSFKQYHKEYGYTFLNILLKSFTEDYIVFFIFIASLSVLINSYNYSKYSPYVFLSLLLYSVHGYIYKDLNQIRSGIAAAIALFTIVQIHNREHIKFFITIFIASFFHIAVLAIFLIYCISFFNIDRNKGILIFLIGVSLGLVGISSIIVGVLPEDLNSATQTINNYSNSTSQSRNLGMFNITNVKSLFIFIALLLFYDRLEKEIKYFKTLFLFYVLAVSWRFAFSDFAILSGRIATFFEIVEVILLPSFLLIFRQKFLISVLIIFYAFLILYLNLSKGKPPYALSIF